ncbi:MAG: mannose-6-phosphate isomerase, class I, partial [Deltaproteobacteria bacterium]|nr:mannose-6-phosphate isomerase, class I [Deltaproteobacteria bacterium]
MKQAKGSNMANAKMNKICILKNPVQEYAWGSKTAIQELLGKPVPSEKPMAEIWMGAHTKAPSKLLIEGKWRPLDEVIEGSPESILGKRVAEKYANKLPFLFKVLAVSSPLSVQVHPDLEQAREGFARENRLGIPLDSPNRDYRDDNHKPELLLAVTYFTGLKGFRRIEEILGLMERIAPSGLAFELNQLRKEPEASGLKSFFKTLMTMDKSLQKKVLVEAVSLAEKRADQDPAFHWMVKLNREYPGDIGVFSPVLLNFVELRPGDALYLEAGELHSYLNGLAMELMANSDNVLRGGLTPKYTDVPELLKLVDFKTGPVRPVKPEGSGTCESVYHTPAREFMLSVISVNKGKTFESPRDRSVEILICMEG